MRFKEGEKAEPEEELNRLKAEQDMGLAQVRLCCGCAWSATAVLPPCMVSVCCVGVGMIGTASDLSNNGGHGVRIC